MFTGLFDLKKPGEYSYMLLDGGAKAELRRGRPPAERLRHEVAFEDLPGDVRLKVVEAYRGMWGLGGD